MRTNPNSQMLLAKTEEKDALKREYPDFDGSIYHQKCPSISFLIGRLIILLETSLPYNSKRMQMIDGKHLSGDHSFKLTKYILSKSSKPFTALYCIMNEHGQVVGWWLTTGTGMKELEDPLSKIQLRHELHGFAGVSHVTTDRCCQERQFWYSVFNLAREEIVIKNASDDDLRILRVIKCPVSQPLVTTREGAIFVVGVVSNYIMGISSDQRIIFIDCEWTIGHAKADLLILALMDGRVFLFHLPQITRNGRSQLPNELKQLLCDPTVKKIGNRIHHEVRQMRGWDVNVTPTIDLGHLARDRALSPTKAPSIDYLVAKLFPGVTVEGKDGNGPRVSDWSGQSNNGQLTSEQIIYAENDGYIMPMVYKQIVRYVDPKLEALL